MTDGVVTVEPVESRAQLRRFADIPYVLHRDDERWSPPLRAFESWRLDARRHPYFDHGDAAYLLARRGGRPVGRIAAHVARAGDRNGWFGFFDAPDDPDVVTALLDAARSWLDDRGARSMTGPVSWTADEQFGVPVAGVEHRGVTGRPWQPAWYAEQLRGAGLEGGETRATYRLPATPARSGGPMARDDVADVPQNVDVTGSGGPMARDDVADVPQNIIPQNVDVTGSGGPMARDDVADVPQNIPQHVGVDGGREVPPHAGGYADPSLVLDGIAAVPDVTGTLARASLRSAWRVARRARQRAFDTAVCVRCDGDPAVLVPRLQSAAGAAGYRWVVAPWAPAGTPPETVHQVFSSQW